MKTQILVLLSILVTALQVQAEERPEACVTLKVIDENGKPIEGATARMSTFLRGQPGPGFGKDINSQVEDRTDAQGMATLRQASLTGEIAYGLAELTGFYRGGGGSYKFQKNEKGKWFPWNPTMEVVIKPIINPVAGYLKRVNLGMPAFRVPVGYDLMVGDWIAPHGKGKVSDFICTAVLDERSDFDFDYELKIAFSNKGDGIQPFTAPHYKGSIFKSPRYAPEDGYLHEWVQIRKRRPGQAEETNYHVENNYFFRVRTVLDEKGKIKSALYGKIYGDFMSFAYYLNPTPNDRNMEFDPKQNLFKNLKSFEKPQDP